MNSIKKDNLIKMNCTGEGVMNGRPYRSNNIILLLEIKWYDRSSGTIYCEI